MVYRRIPEMFVKRNKTPMIYLDTCAMIELARYENGRCTDAHKQEIGELYDLLLSMMSEKRVICPMGNQLQEMGMTKAKEPAKLFLYRFTNSELLHPDLILNAQMKMGYQAFVSSDRAILLGASAALKEEKYQNSPFIVHAAPVYHPEKAKRLQQEKYRIVDILNEMKTSKKTKSDFDSQLRAELESEYILFLNDLLGNRTFTEAEFTHYAEELMKFYRTTGIDPNCTTDQFWDGLVSYGAFLRSPYHDLLPYIWIRANLWAHLMQRPNKIVQGDNLDVQWAAAYLPYLEYAVTDHAFCTLLRNSGLAELYGTKVYSLRTLDLLLNELKSLRSVV